MSTALFSIVFLLTMPLCLLSWQDAGGQPISQAGGWPPLQILDVEKGLPQSFVSGVVLDDDGFIWVGTLDGLARYDGRRFVTFQHQDDDPTSPIDNAVSGLWKGAKNEIWVHYENGEIDRLDTRMGRFWHLTRQPAFAIIKKLPFTVGCQLKVDHQGNLWGTLLNKGIFHCDFKRNKIQQLGRTIHGLASDTVKAIAEDRQQRLWVITQNGLSQFDRATNRFINTAYPLPLVRPEGYTAAGAEKLGVLVRTSGELMFSDRKKLYFFDPNRHTFRIVDLSIEDKEGIRHIAQSPKGGEWIEYAGTVYRYTDQQGLTPVWRYQPSKDNLSTGLWCTDISFDQAGVLWIGGNTLGLLRLDLAATPLHTYSYKKAFCQDVVQQELDVSLMATYRWPFTNETANSQSSYIMRSSYDPWGRLWIGLGDQIGCYHTQQKKITLLPTVPSKITASFNNGLRGLSIAPDGKIWVVTEQGEPYWYDSLTSCWQALFRGRLTALPPTLTNDLLVDSTSLWVTTIGKGLLHYTLDARRYQAFRFGSPDDKQANPTLLDLEQDPTRSHLLWIGSYQGLICFNKRTHRYQRFTTAHGLPNNTIYSVVPDRQGYLWLSTNKGLCRFHPIRHTVLSLQTADGLPGNEFNRFHHLKLPNGQLAFGGIKGWLVFDPALIKEDTLQPVVALTELFINNQSVAQYGTDSPLPTPVNNASDLQLAYNQNYVTFEFAALHCHQPDRVVYRYKLRGYDDRWTISNQPRASYTKLPPGQYTLEVNAGNETGQWSRHVKELSIAVLPPFWAGGWAYSLYTLLAVSGLVGFVRFRTKRERERNELLLREQQANELRQLDLAKTRFFANVSHELRTPLTLMLGPLKSVLLSRELTSKDEYLVQTAQRNAENLLGLVNELLDLTKLEAGKMQLNSQAVRVKSLVSGLVASFDSLARQKEITLTSELAVRDELIVQLDERKLRQVLTNLLANALKFTPTDGFVKVTLNYVEPQLHIAVLDTGRGISPDDLPYVFDRYFQTRQSDTPLEGGTGIGLALCQELVRLMQGTLRVESQLGQGSTFRIELPAPLSSMPQQESDAESLVLEEVAGGNSTKQLAEEAKAHCADVVLVVEDNPDLRNYLVTILSPLFTVQTAENGQVALTRLAELPLLPSLIVSDIMMPVMDGFQLLETLKGNDTYRRIPVIMLTARAEMVDRLRALRIGVDDYLLKPFDEEELMARIASLLHNQRERSVALTTEVVEVSQNDDPSLPTTALSSEDSLWLERLEMLTMARLSNFDLTADELASELAASRRTFYRTVKRLTGMTPAQYLSEARFRQARFLLETRQVSTVKQVAYQVGFRQVSHFAQTYQQRFGKAPADYL
ncbi:ATP-binding protein [Spirosoma oryzicola]|uniref:ATP-binding protein n=1 Tax=Spirosoma oryzicola TaxID=2898794 RepID=UPI001E2F8E26|nr:ATP-binding protein [Spirosoma oryzicola]UHG94129.1 ATP-binding protein [Spirosoma oryzicola]